MSLLDLSSDLSRFRSEVSREPKSSPEASKATTNKNFATFQPITEKLSQYSSAVSRVEPKKLEESLKDTRLDDIRKFAMENLIINQVSKYSTINTTYDTRNINGVSLEQIASRLNQINQREFVSQLNRSDVLITTAERGTNNLQSPIEVNVADRGTNNLVSPTDVNSVEVGTNNLVSPTDVLPDTYGTNNLVSPVDVNESISGQNNLTSPLDVKPIPGDASDNITNPDIGINTIPLSLDRSGQSVQINTDLLSPINNVINPDVALLPTTLTFDRVGQSAQIITETIKQGLVVDPDTQVLRMENGTFHLNDESRLNPDGQPIRFVTTSRLAERTLPREIDSERYDGESQQLTDNSRLNLDSVFKTNPAGRHENPDESRLSIIGTQEINVFQDTNARGFIVRAQKNETRYTGQSSFSWDGAPPSTNFITDINGDGFQTFTQPLETSYNAESSIFGFVNIPETDFFDVTKQYTSEGFKSFVLSLQSAYQLDSSVFGWSGNREQAPTTNYFDLQGTSTTDGFHKFAQLLDSKYVVDASQFDWDGNRTEAPEVNYFDLTGRNTTTGFHKFASLYDTKYVPESSVYDWDGTRQNAPEVNYFDLSSQHTTTGFHKFASLYDTKYIPESSLYDWDGTRENAPEVNYFDLTTQHTTAGFHRFAQLYDTKYIPESSIYDWDGNRTSAPEVNYFDISGQYTTIGFHRFAQIYDTKYIPESSRFDWDGVRSSSPEVNYFDITGQFTTKGFHRLAELYETKYIPESSQFDWDGTRTSAPEVNYFDLTGTHTTSGFHRLAQLYDSKYVKDSSIFDFDGTRQDAPVTDYFQNQNTSGFTKFPTALQTEYETESSRFTFTGNLPNPIDYFTNEKSSGFTLRPQKLQTEYVTDISEFTFKGSSQQAPTVNYFTNDSNTGFTSFAQSLVSEYQSDVSRFTFAGNRQQSPAVNNIVDSNGVGFTTLSQILETKYIAESSRYSWVGNRTQAPSVDYFSVEPNSVTGFDTFFTNPAETKLSYEPSRFSFGGAKNVSPIRNAPYTTFFGFRPQERTGFMVGMDNPNASLYPIVNPKLSVNDSPDTRLGIETQRGKRGISSTQQGEIYAPLSLGRRPWADGTLFATLDNQISNVVTNAPAGAFNNKYELSMLNTTNRTGYLTEWARTRRSPSPLDNQYNKYKLQNESVNFEPAFFFQPYIVRGIQRDGEVENQRWGFGAGIDEGVVRGGYVTKVERQLADTIRLGKWFASVKGLLFSAKQTGLQSMNPNVDVDPRTPTANVFFGAANILGLNTGGEFDLDNYNFVGGKLSATQFFNPASLIANVSSAADGVHIARHGIVLNASEYLNKYEKATVNRELNQLFVDVNYSSFSNLPTPSESNRDPGGTTGKGYNRLIGLMREMIPNSFSPLINSSPTATDPASVQSKKAAALTKEMFGKSNIVRLSSPFGGAQSYLGVGGTTIRKSSHPYLTFYNTAPNLYNQTKEPQYLDSAKRESFFGAIEETTYKDRLKSEQSNNDGKDFYGILRALTKILTNAPNDPIGGTLPPNFKETIPTQASTKNRIEKLSPLNPKYELPLDRLQRITEANASRGGSPLHMGISNEAIDNNPIKKYRVASYDKLQKVRKGEGNRTDRFNDFRYDLNLTGSDAFITKPDLVDFKQKNLEDWYGMGNPGKVGAKRDNPAVTNVLHRKQNFGIDGGKKGNDDIRTYPVPVLKPGQEFRGDRINIIDYKRANFNLNKNSVYEKGQYADPSLPGKDDLVEFYFSSVVLSGHNYCPAEVIVFRATFDSIQDNHSPSWNPIKYMGRADPLYVYQGYERSISFGFTVHIGSRDEMKASWRKLNYLASWTAPEYTKAGFIRGPLIRLNIGNLYRKMPGFLSSLSYTFDNTNGHWETANLDADNIKNSASGPGVLQLPKTIQVSCEFTPVGVYRPEFRGVMYSLYEDRGNPENGLIPIDPNSVNYFKTYDDIGMESPENDNLMPVRVNDVDKNLIENLQDGTPENLGQN